VEKETTRGIKEALVGYEVTAGCMRDEAWEIFALKTIIALQRKATFKMPTETQMRAAFKDAGVDYD
jgi:hypothetical protein